MSTSTVDPQVEEREFAHPVFVDHNCTPEDLVAIGRATETVALSRALKYHLQHRVLLNEHKAVIFR